MINGNKILIGVPPRSHVLLAQDEVDGLVREGFECETVSYGRNKNVANQFNRVLFTIRKAISLVKKLKTFKPDFLYLNSRFEPVGSSRDFISLLIVKMFYRRKLKIVIKSHGSNIVILSTKKYWYKNLVVPFLKKTVDAWIFLSSEELDLISKYEPGLADKIHILPNIIEPHRAKYSEAFREKHRLNDKKFTILYAGRIVSEKGVFDIVNALPLLKCRNECKMIFIGDGSKCLELKKAVETLGLDSQVEFKGFIPESECDHFYANTDALVYPTYDTEGFPMAIFKSVACGMSVITTQIRAAKDYLSDPENALWVLPKDPASIADAIDRIYHDPELKHNMKINNTQLGKKFSSARISAEMKNKFLSLNPTR